MQYSQEHLKTMVYAKFGGQTECIMGNWKIENRKSIKRDELSFRVSSQFRFFDFFCSKTVQISAPRIYGHFQEPEETHFELASFA